MANAGINIRSVAQCSSERQISVVVANEECTKALRAAHAALALSNTQLSIAILGATGAVGSEFLQQVVDSKQLIDATDPGGKRKAISDLGIDFKVTAVARSKLMRLSYDGIDVSADEETLFAPGEPGSRDEGEVQPADL